jgi:hypothetical protein
MRFISPVVLSLDLFVSQPRPLVDRSMAVRLLKWQLALTMGVTVFGLLGGLWAGISAGMGGGIALAGSAYFALQAFRHAGATSAAHIVRSFYKGEGRTLCADRRALCQRLYHGAVRARCLAVNGIHLGTSCGRMGRIAFQHHGNKKVSC